MMAIQKVELLNCQFAELKRRFITYQDHMVLYPIIHFTINKISHIRFVSVSLIKFAEGFT